MANAGFVPDEGTNQPVDRVTESQSSIVVVARLNLLDCEERYFRKGNQKDRPVVDSSWAAGNTICPKSNIPWTRSLAWSFSQGRPRDNVTGRWVWHEPGLWTSASL